LPGADLRIFYDRNFPTRGLLNVYEIVSLKVLVLLNTKIPSKVFWQIFVCSFRCEFCFNFQADFCLLRLDENICPKFRKRSRPNWKSIKMSTSHQSYQTRFTQFYTYIHAYICMIFLQLHMCKMSYRFVKNESTRFSEYV
jgi:hypothetical protein